MGKVKCTLIYLCLLFEEFHVRLIKNPGSAITFVRQAKLMKKSVVSPIEAKKFTGCLKDLMVFTDPCTTDQKCVISYLAECISDSL